ncbi:CAP domain-containing protein [Paenochrobactrum sp. BZR 588]|uniref:CAP domain-containing protein n=1 Tax=unclassified Paenochrobactrum TaxID=2639760 RepID=UPI0038534AA8
MKSELVTRRNCLQILAGGAGVFVWPSLLNTSLAQAASDPTELFNSIRRQNGLSQMATDPKLEQAALYQAKRMASHGKIGHSIGWGNGFVARLKQAGIRGPAAENVASGQKDTDAVFKAWMNSAGHRKNMLDPVFDRYGLAWATPENKPHYIYWAMMLGVAQIL